MKNLLDFPKDKWSAITYQLAILSANIYLFTQGTINTLLLYSALLVLSLFTLQAVSRRFRLLHPHRGDFQVNVEFLDTKLLRTFLIVSIFLLLLGIVNSPIIADEEVSRLFGIKEWVNEHINLHFFTSYFSFFASLFLLLLPLFWHSFMRSVIKERIIEKVKSIQAKKIGVCPYSSEACKHYSEITIELVFYNENGSEIPEYRKGSTPVKKVSRSCELSHDLNPIYEKFRIIA